MALRCRFRAPVEEVSSGSSYVAILDQKSLYLLFKNAIFIETVVSYILGLTNCIKKKLYLLI